MSRNKYKENNIQLPVFLDLLTLLFVALKLIGVIDWSWWWVLSPIWISLGLLAVACLVAFTYGFVNNKVKRPRRNKTRI